MTYAKSGLFWSQCFLPSLVIRKAQAGGGKSSLGPCGIIRVLSLPLGVGGNINICHTIFRLL